MVRPRRSAEERQIACISPQGRRTSPLRNPRPGSQSQLNFIAACLPGTEHCLKRAEGREIRNVSSLSLFGLAFFMLVMIGAFAVRSAAGFGAVLIAMPMLAFVLPVSTAVSVTTALTAITSVHHVSRDWRRVAWRHFAIMAFYSAIGIGLGFYFISMLDEHALRRSLGVFLILYSIYSLATAKVSRTVSTRWRGPLAASTGIAGGLLGTLFGAGVGPIYVVYFDALRLEREIFRVTMSTVVLLGGAARIAGYASFGFYERSSIMLIAIGLPLVVVGSWLGDRVIRRLDPQMFSWLLGGLILLSGVGLLVK
jgi:uncharacterized protein